MLKKILLLFFVSLLLAQSIEFSVYFKYKLNEIHRSVKLKLKEGVSDEELVLFEFTDQESEKLTWTRKNEFKFHGAFYDVVRKIELYATKTRYFCIRDDDEKALFAMYSDLFQVNIDKELDGENPIHVVIELFKKPLCLTDFTSNITFLSFEIQRKDFFKNSSLLESNFSKVQDQPPRLFC